MFSALSIAGSDCSGGAGIQADIKAFSANGVFGQSAITAVTDENTQGVYGIHKVPPAFVAGQIRSCLSDIGASAIKIGMLDDQHVIVAVKEALLEFKTSIGFKNIVLDPVMVATSGDRLLEDSAVETLKNELIPLAKVITPNVPEAEVLLGQNITAADFEHAARDLSKLGGAKPVSVWLKAGHLENEVLVDYFFNAETDEIVKLSTPRIHTRNTHGTGCTLSSALAAQLAKGVELNTAVKAAKAYINNAIESAKDWELGKGHGPVNHFFMLSES